MSKAFETLGLTPDCSMTQLKEAWRRAAKQHHPDAGGDAEKFDEARKAYSTCMMVISKRRCKSCKGSGEETLANGFNQLKKRCKECRGTGVEVPV